MGVAGGQRRTAMKSATEKDWEGVEGCHRQAIKCELSVQGGWERGLM